MVHLPVGVRETTLPPSLAGLPGLFVHAMHRATLSSSAMPARGTTKGSAARPAAALGRGEIRSSCEVVITEIGASSEVV